MFSKLSRFCAILSDKTNIPVDLSAKSLIKTVFQICFFFLLFKPCDAYIAIFAPSKWPASSSKKSLLVRNSCFSSLLALLPLRLRRQEVVDVLLGGSGSEDWKSAAFPILWGRVSKENFVFKERSRSSQASWGQKLQVTDAKGKWMSRFKTKTGKGSPESSRTVRWEIFAKFKNFVKFDLCVMW